MKIKSVISNYKCSNNIRNIVNQNLMQGIEVVFKKFLNHGTAFDHSAHMCQRSATFL